MDLDTLEIVGGSNGVISRSKSSARICAVSSRVEEIADGAFLDNRNLEAVIVPAGIRKIGRNAFTDRPGHPVMIYFQGSASEWDEVDLDEQVKEIPRVITNDGYRIYHI